MFSVMFVGACPNPVASNTSPLNFLAVNASISSGPMFTYDRITATLSSIAECNTAGDLLRLAYGEMNCTVPSTVTVAMGLAFTALNASRRVVCTLRVLVAGSILQTPSDALAYMHTATPAKSEWMMNWAAQSRLNVASEPGRSVERCAPTSSTGIGRDSNMNANAAAVTANVSVPCPMMIPSTPALTCCSMALAIC